MNDLRYSVLRRQLARLTTDQLWLILDARPGSMVHDDCNYDNGQFCPLATALGITSASGDEDCARQIRAAGFNPRNMRGVAGDFYRGVPAVRDLDIRQLVGDILEDRQEWSEWRPASIYAAGPSADPAEADMFCRMLADAGWQVTSTWPGSVTAAGGGNPVQSTEDQRFVWSESDRLQVEEADVLWARTPPPGVVTHGTFWELGYARGRDKHVVVSGPDHHRSIFTAQADVTFATHAEAVAYLSRLIHGGEPIREGLTGRPPRPTMV